MLIYDAKIQILELVTFISNQVFLKGSKVDQLTNSSLAGISENNLNKNLSSLLVWSVNGKRMYFPGGTSNLLVFAL